MEKTLLIASFIFPERVDWFLDYLKRKFDINKDDVYCYENLDNNSKLIFTFKLKVINGNKLNLKELFPNAITLHKKGSTFYTINGLNKLIDSLHKEFEGNIDYKNIKINWDEYKNSMILTNSEMINILRIKRIF
jgi:hypothetical protein